jgi:hypothetical protein
MSNKKIIISTFFVLLISTIISCQNLQKDKVTFHVELPLILKKYGSFIIDDESLEVELELNQFENWHQLIERTDQIVCNDSVPKITFENEQEIKIVYFQNHCWERYFGMEVKRRNIIEICNDTIVKASYYYSLDSLESMIRKDMQNFGKIPIHCERPEVLIFYVTVHPANIPPNFF